MIDEAQTLKGRKSEEIKFEIEFTSPLAVATSTQFYLQLIFWLHLLLPLPPRQTFQSPEENPERDVFNFIQILIPHFTAADMNIITTYLKNYLI